MSSDCYDFTVYLKPETAGLDSQLQTFRISRFMVASASLYFLKLLPYIKGDSVTLHIDDPDFVAGKVLSCMHTGSLEVSPKDLMQCYKFADFWQIPSLCSELEECSVSMPDSCVFTLHQTAQESGHGSLISLMRLMDTAYLWAKIPEHLEQTSPEFIEEFIANYRHLKPRTNADHFLLLVDKYIRERDLKWSNGVLKNRVMNKDFFTVLPFSEEEEESELDFLEDAKFESLCCSVPWGQISTAALKKCLNNENIPAEFPLWELNARKRNVSQGIKNGMWQKSLRELHKYVADQAVRKVAGLPEISLELEHFFQHPSDEPLVEEPVQEKEVKLMLKLKLEFKYSTRNSDCFIVLKSTNAMVPAHLILLNTRIPPPKSYNRLTILPEPDYPYPPPTNLLLDFVMAIYDISSLKITIENHVPLLLLSRVTGAKKIIKKLDQVSFEESQKSWEIAKRLITRNVDLENDIPRLYNACLNTIDIAVSISNTEDSIEWQKFVVKTLDSLSKNGKLNEEQHQNAIFSLSLIWYPDIDPGSDFVKILTEKLN